MVHAHSHAWPQKNLRRLCISACTMIQDGRSSWPIRSIHRCIVEADANPVLCLQWGKWCKRKSEETARNQRPPSVLPKGHQLGRAKSLLCCCQHLRSSCLQLLLPCSAQSIFSFGPFMGVLSKASGRHSALWDLTSMLTRLSSWIPSELAELARISYVWCHMHFPLSLLHADSKTSQCLLKTGNTAVTSGCKANTAGLEPSCDQVTVIFASCPGLSIPNLRPLEGLWLHIMAWIQCLGMSFALPARSRFLWGPLQIYSARLLMTLKRGEAVFCAARVVAGHIASTRVPCSANLTCFHWQCSTLIHRIHGPFI